MSYEHFIPYKGSRCPIQALKGERLEETLEETRDRICTEKLKVCNEQGIPKEITMFGINCILDFYNAVK